MGRYKEGGSGGTPGSGTVEEVTGSAINGFNVTIGNDPNVDPEIEVGLQSTSGAVQKSDGAGGIDDADETGEGAVVLQDEPTINAPIIQAGKIDYVIEPATDDTFEGEMTNDILSGDTIAQWDLVYLDSTSGRWEFADADAEATSGGVLLALAAEAKTDGQAMNVILRGIVRNDGWTWSGVDKPIYASTTLGGLTETPPSGTDDVIRIVGYTLSDDAIYFNPSNEWTVHT